MIEVEADHDTLLFMLEEAKQNQLAEIKKINARQDEHYRLTLNIEETKQSRAEALEWHAQVKLQTYNEEKANTGHFEGHANLLKAKHEELRLLNEEVMRATDRLALEVIKTQRNEETAQRMVHLISKELESNDQQKKDMKRDKKLLSKLK